MMRKKLQTALTILIAFNISLYAGGSKNTSFADARMNALGGLNFAGINGFSSLTLNPAAINYFSGGGLFVSVSDIMKQNEFYREEKGLFQSYREDNFELSGGVYWKPLGNFGFGLSYYPSVNHYTDWPYVVYESNDSNSVILPFNLYNDMDANNVSASVSFGDEGFSAGISFNAIWFRQKTAFPVNNPVWENNLGTAAYQHEIDRDGWGFNFSAGLLYEISENIRFGAAVKSGYTVSLEGEAKSAVFGFLDSASTTSSVSGDYEMPWSFGGGIVYRINERTRINLDVNYTLWSGLSESVKYEYDNPAWNERGSGLDTLSFISPGSIRMELENSFDAAMGIEHAVQNFRLMLGYRYSQSPNSDITYSFLFPNVDEHWVSAGFAYLEENYTITISLAYSFGVKTNISQSPFSELVGEYDSDAYVPSATIHYRL